MVENKDGSKIPCRNWMEGGVCNYHGNGRFFEGKPSLARLRLNTKKTKFDRLGCSAAPNGHISVGEIQKQLQCSQYRRSG